ncbi:uncharacterized protein [Nicotiana sylvestris]|uniref:uncharacterized protein n=1 Tax=Nicotiana sylvestris TaxID=4096 RepID=UPI00388C7514
MTELVGSHTASIQKLEMQMRDLSREQNPKQKGILPSDTIANPKSSGSGPTSHIMAITTQSGKVLQGESEQVVEVEESERLRLKSQVLLKLKRKVDDSKLEKFYDILKQLSVNIPFVKAFQEMSGFAKYLKDLITKNRTTKNKVVNMTHRVSSIITTSTVQKKEDSRAFTIPCTIGAHDFARAHYDNGTSINLIPLAIYKQAGLGRALMDSERNEIKFCMNDEEVTFQESKVEDAVEMKMEEQCLGVALVAILVNFNGEDIEGYMESVEQLLDVLKEHKQAIGWTIADIGGIPAGICEHKIQLENETKPSVEHQRRLNSTMQEVVKKEIIKWLDAEIVYPIADSSWVSPVQCVPQKGGMTVIENDKIELIPTRTVNGWTVCMDYRKLNSATCKDHFSMPFIDQMLDRLAGRSFYCFLDGYSGYNQINIALEDQEKTTFTCPYGTFAFIRMLFG